MTACHRVAGTTQIVTVEESKKKKRRGDRVDELTSKFE